MTWSIVCDSSCDLNPAVLIPGKLTLQVIPLTITVEETHYIDDEHLDPAQMLHHMAASAGPTSTACPSPAAFAEAFRQADCSLCFTISGNLSGTYASAVTAREMVLEESPEKKIFVLDARSTAGSLILLTRQARALLEAGEERFERICKALQDYRDGMRTVFTLENFDNLVKNGRMRPLLGSLLHTLGIHVIAEGTREGTIRVVDKARGEARTIKALLHQMQLQKECRDADVVISHCQNLDGAAKLRQAIQQRLPVRSVSTMSGRGLNSFYAMDKGLILVF